MTRTERRAAERQGRKLAKKGQRAGLMETGRAWVAAGALAAYAVAGSSRMTLAAVSASYAADGGGTAAALPLKRFDIGAGPLDVVLAAYEQATGLQVRIDLPKGAAAGFQSKGVKGLYRLEEALRLLLEGTGLQGDVQPGATATEPTIAVVGLRRADTVTVTGEAQDSVAMTKFTRAAAGYTADGGGGAAVCAA